MSAELRRYAVENRPDLSGQTAGVLRDVFAVKLEDVPLLAIDRREIAFRDEHGDRLRHSANDHVLPHKFHRPTVNRVLWRFTLLVRHSECFQQKFVPCRPEEFVPIHRSETDPPFLAWDLDVLHVLVNGHKAARLKIVEPSVLDEPLDRLPRPREKLYLIKDYQTMPLHETYAVVGGKVEEEIVKAVELRPEHLLDLVAR